MDRGGTGETESRTCVPVLPHARGEVHRMPRLPAPAGHVSRDGCEAQDATAGESVCRLFASLRSEGGAAVWIVFRSVCQCGAMGTRPGDAEAPAADGGGVMANSQTQQLIQRLRDRAWFEHVDGDGDEDAPPEITWAEMAELSALLYEAADALAATSEVE